MPRIVIILALFVSMSIAACTSADEAPPQVGASSVSDQPIALDWKLADGETIAYLTAMKSIESPTIDFNFDELLEEGADTPGMAILDGLEQFAQLYYGTPQEYNFISTLHLNERGNITVLMIMDSLTSVEEQPEMTFEPPSQDIGAEEWEQQLRDAVQRMQQDMQGTVQLRGEIAPAGEVTSFYLPDRQKNLLAIFFELPSQPVRIGETWELDFQCVEIGAGFIFTQSNRINQVTFSEVSTLPDGRQIAVLDYLMLESASGYTDSHLLSGIDGATNEPRAFSTQCSFVGQGQFLINEGRWHQLVGEMSISSVGILDSSQTQRFAITPLDEVPPQYIGLE